MNKEEVNPFIGFIVFIMLTSFRGCLRSTDNSSYYQYYSESTNEKTYHDEILMEIRDR